MKYYILNQLFGIFDLEVLRSSTNEFLDNIDIDNIKIEEDTDKSIILTEKNKKIKGYITNISSITLEKRAINGGYNG